VTITKESARTHAIALSTHLAATTPNSFLFAGTQSELVFRTPGGEAHLFLGSLTLGWADYGIWLWHYDKNNCKRLLEIDRDHDPDVLTAPDRLSLLVFSEAIAWGRENIPHFAYYSGSWKK
jgi:hypothetical protein